VDNRPKKTAVRRFLIKSPHVDTAWAAVIQSMTSSGAVNQILSCRVFIDRVFVLPFPIGTYFA
jgi:hypothetical protein